MKRLVILIKSTLALGSLLLLPTFSFAQCENWVDSPNKDAAEEAHVLYRDFIKNEDYDQAFEYWKKAYELAPAADGQRPFHYMDGRKLYMEKFKQETDEARKKEYADIILRLYDEQIQCYDDEANLLAMKAYDMFYYLGTPYSELLETLKKAVEVGGMNTSYIVFDPYARVIVYNYKNDKATDKEAREVFLKLNEIADHNIAKNDAYSEYFQQGKDAMNGSFREIESEIFDCNYFVNKYQPLYNENPADYETLQKIYKKLVAEGCDTSMAFVMQVKTSFDSIASIVNAERLAEFYKKNPGSYAKALFDEGKYTQAIESYKEAIKKEKSKGDSTNWEQVATYTFSMASILGRHLGRYSEARSYAYDAAKLKDGWGRPYMLIGDLYAKSSSSCGNESWDHQMAVIAAINKWEYARSVDPEVADEAREKIGRYYNYLPLKGDVFMRGMAGKSEKVKCWIGEKVKVRYREE